ncbi:MAG: hypothetical protein HZB19_07380 [Chloroflexi bacterium]|nr:hypothetical protein [Chloroflexota bacterium]
MEPYVQIRHEYAGFHSAQRRDYHAGSVKPARTRLAGPRNLQLEADQANGRVIADEKHSPLSAPPPDPVIKGIGLICQRRECRFAPRRLGRCPEPLG